MAVKNISKGSRRIRKYKYLFLELGKKIHGCSFAKRFAVNFPETYRFLSARFSLYTFSGLPLTFLVFAALSNFLVFYITAEIIVTSAGIVSLDNSIAQYFFDMRTKAIDIPIFYFSKLGSPPFVIGIFSFAIIILLFLKKYVYILALLISLSGSTLTMYFSKLHFQRVRPEIFMYYDVASFSFPSGHSIIAVSFYGLLSYFLIRNIKQHQGYIIAAALFFINFIGFTRIYLGVHYLTDVIAGFALGTMWLMLAISIVEWENTRGVD